jgi:hypothetical protein
MSDLPTPETLANVVDETSQAMFGVPVMYAGDCDNGLPTSTSPTEPTVIVPLIGNPLYIITAHADQHGGPSLASAMFSCELNDTSPEMVEDSLRELCNIVAGQVKSLMAPDHEIGLPSRLTDSTTLKDVQQWSGAKIRVGSGASSVDIGVAEFAGLG